MRSHSETVVSILTQYRVLKFISINCDTSGLHRSVRELGIGTYCSDGWAPLSVARLNTRVHELIRVFSSGGIGGVPVVDERGGVADLYGAVDAGELLRTGLYTDIDLTVREAIVRRAPPSHATQAGAAEAQASHGVWVASVDEPLANVFALLERRRIHRLILVEDAPLRDLTPSELGESLAEGQQALVPKGHGRLAGILTLSDIVSYIVGHLPPPSSTRPVAAPTDETV